MPPVAPTAPTVTAGVKIRSQSVDEAAMATAHSRAALDDSAYAEMEAAVATLADSGDEGAARARLLGFIDQHPACAEAYNDLGVLTYQGGDLPAAIEAIDRAIALHPERPRYHRNRALALLASGEVEPALMALARSLSLDPNDTETLKIAADLETARSQSQTAPFASPLWPMHPA
jgi:tetratricopeptide (TPR) repeat protein